MYMHDTIKTKSQLHIWVQIISSIKVIHFLSHRYIHEFYSLVFTYTHTHTHEFTLFIFIGFFMVYLY